MILRPDSGVCHRHTNPQLFRTIFTPIPPEKNRQKQSRAVNRRKRLRTIKSWQCFALWSAGLFSCGEKHLVLHLRASQASHSGRLQYSTEIEHQVSSSGQIWSGNSVYQGTEERPAPNKSKVPVIALNPCCTITIKHPHADQGQIQVHKLTEATCLLILTKQAHYINLWYSGTAGKQRVY
jgi:hypothetical protein